MVIAFCYRIKLNSNASTPADLDINWTYYAEVQLLIQQHEIAQEGKRMPLLRFDVIEGRNPDALKQLLDVAHQAMVDAFEVPQRDRYQIVHQHSAHEMIIEDTGLGLERSRDIVVISIVSKARTPDKKQKLYALLAQRLESECGLSPQDLMVSITENGEADWSFGMGEAQFITGKL